MYIILVRYYSLDEPERQHFCAYLEKSPPESDYQVTSQMVENKICDGNIQIISFSWTKDDGHVEMSILVD